jgi:hypothetical protein
MLKTTIGTGLSKEATQAVAKELAKTEFNGIRFRRRRLISKMVNVNVLVQPCGICRCKRAARHNTLERRR